MVALLAFGSAPEIAWVIDKELFNYTYTFPRAGNVSLSYLGELI
jgi:hypothetical protein